MDGDPRLDAIGVKLEGIESTLADIKRDFSAAEKAPAPVVKVAEVSVPKKASGKKG